MAVTPKKSMDSLRYEIRERVALRLATGSRWTVGEALRRRARRRMRESLLMLGALGGGMAIAIAAASMLGLL